MTRKSVALMGACAAALALVLAGCGQTTSEQSVDAPPSITPITIAGGDDLQFCEEVQRRVTVADCEYFTQLAERATKGLGSFNAPKDMERGDAQPVTLALSPAPAPIIADETPAPTTTPTPTPPDVSTGGEDGQTRGPETEVTTPVTPHDVVDGLPGETIDYEPIVGRFMRAELSSNGGLEITQLSPISQEVIPGEITTWNWRVKATEGGVHRLELRTVVEGCTDDARQHCYALKTTTTPYDVSVSVGWLGKLEDFLLALPDWIKMITGVLVALTALVGAVAGLRTAFKKKEN